MSLALGTRYTLDTEIGRGGMDVAHDAQVAVKVLVGRSEGQMALRGCEAQAPGRNPLRPETRARVPGRGTRTCGR
jgi:hypothetical protein